MNWLTPSCSHIRSLRSIPRACRDAAVLWVAELSGICDKWSPDAPAPAIGTETDDVDLFLSIGWVTAAPYQSRLCVMIQQADSDPKVQLVHRTPVGATWDVTNPPHEVLRNCMRIFFEERT